jgi:Uma2 family endonuclease
MHMVSHHAGAWTLDQLHRLPDDGNKYELVHGALYVTPAPSVHHERLLAALTRLLVPYVDRWSVGEVFHPRSVIRHSPSEVEPDLMVRPVPAGGESDWERLPLPELVIEVVSGSSRLRDYNQKRDFYLELGIPEYWIVDGGRRTITIVRPGTADVVAE